MGWLPQQRSVSSHVGAGNATLSNSRSSESDVLPMLISHLYEGLVVDSLNSRNVGNVMSGAQALGVNAKNALQGGAWGSLPAGASCSKGRVSMHTHASHRLVTKLLQACNQAAEPCAATPQAAPRLAQ